MRERWGTFSVRDHMHEAAFVSDVLLYDRLVIPVPDPHDAGNEPLWSQWNPERQQKCLEILEVKTDQHDGLALTVPWGQAKHERFANCMSMAAALATQQRSPEQTYYLDPFEMTRQLLKHEFLPAPAANVSKVWAVAAYSSADAYFKELAKADRDRHRQLAAAISYRFLTPAGPDPDHSLLKRAVDLAIRDDFRRKRQQFYEWQEQVIENDISSERALVEMDQHLDAYNQAIEAAFRQVRERFVYMMLGATVGIAGAAIGGSLPGMLLAASAGGVSLVQFWRFDSKPSIEAGDFDAAAMIHDARKQLRLA